MFDYKNGKLHAEQLDCETLAGTFGTPLYVYSRAAIESAWRAFDQVLRGHRHLVCYAVKANSNIGVLSLLARLGSGFDIVSVGELERVLAAGGEADKTIFSGVGKNAGEMERALEVGIRCFNVESIGELERLAEVAKAHGVTAPVSLRVNPDVDARTHPYISTGLKENKFGILMEMALAAYRRAAELPNLEVQGVDCHIGSQLTEIKPFVDALERLLALIDTLEQDGINISHLDLGGGQGIRYKDEMPLNLQAWADAIVGALEGRDLEIIIEPGRAVVGNAGILLTRIEYLKHSDYKNFAVVDAAMNDLIRPSLYSAWQEILPVRQQTEVDSRRYDVVGPVCESSDFLGKDRLLGVEQGDLLAVMSSGAYAFAMSSNYNTRPRAAEVIVDGDKAKLVRQREQLSDLFGLESVF
ncbi:MAG: diaminopimelate decarboxylase [Gammaproteobacteria bacterium]|nr:diaminopimelate decarboxylase [Gammaproteobacteria bacterium]